MNITSLFHHQSQTPLLFNVEGETPSGSWTSHALYQEVARLSRGLTDHGVHAGDALLVLSGNRVETYAFSLALFNVGALAMPLSLGLGQESVLAVLRERRPTGCLVEGPLPPVLAAALAETCRLCVTLQPGPALAFPATVAYADLGDAEEPLRFGYFEASQPALLVHSSGSQGRPKAIQLSHGQLFNYFHYHDLIHRQLADDALGEGVQAPLLSVFQPSHLAAYSLCLQGLLMRRPTYLLPDFEPAGYLRLLADLRCRLSVLVPSMYLSLLKETELLAGLDLSALSLCFSIGEGSPLPLMERIEKAFASKCLAAYGLSECLPGIAHAREDIRADRIPHGSCGRLLFDEARLVDATGQDSNPGELWLRNPTVHRCYSDEALNAAKFTADGWLKTGDRFHRDAEGQFFHRGRMDDMFVVNGRNLYPGDIEKVLLAHPGVAQAIAAALRDEEGRVLPAAVLQTARDLPEEGILDFFLARGPSHAVPRFILQRRALPELGPGKLDRRACGELLRQAWAAARNGQRSPIGRAGQKTELAQTQSEPG